MADLILKILMDIGIDRDKFLELNVFIVGIFVFQDLHL
jgi:hypothetical protein